MKRATAAGNELDASAAPGWMERLASLVLTDDRKQRRAIMMVLTTAAMYSVCLALLAFGVLYAVFPVEQIRVLAVLLALTAPLFYFLIRCGFNLRLRQTTLAFPQALVAQSVVAFAYAVCGPIHSATIVFLAMVTVFGMFDMSTRQVRVVLFYTLGLMAMVMTWRVHTDPQVYQGPLELMYFAMMATCLSGISMLSVLVSKMRKRLRTQKDELARALARIQIVATHDELTGLTNRHHMIALLGEHISRHARGGPGFAVALADIDYFKNVNDTHGHRVGDEALITFANQACAQLRSVDLVARWGGEEFLLLLPETKPPGDPNSGIERLRAALALTPASAHVPALRIAFSTGLTRYIDGEAIDDMIERADRALYAAKDTGRNRTVMV
ncbi:GGDEF domain-containing protein [Massilia sp. P8910]|uniref:diguanylate cyclase domain-containing protein n=1 Tax=Massilia antarctica TaxID=2765360 RepID=UPI001E34E5F6|nr:diguanylate cyclase [Massilia antarctica]MCE3607298.1 GGDEF domain-containing protein [Massilia antarctica]